MALPIRMASVHVVWFLAVWVGLTLAVDKNSFKTCSQSGFCRRQREFKPEKNSYVALLDTASIEPSKFTIDLLNQKNNVKFNLQVSSLANNMARLRIEEAEPLIPRYEPPIGDVLLKEPETQPMEVQPGSGTTTLTFQNNQIVIQANPFRIDFLVDKEPVVIINARGLLKFEHTREKQKAEEKPEGEAQEGEEQQDVEQEEEKENEEEPDMWEETYKTHTDSKIHGPQSIGLDFSFPAFQHVYGIPEHAETLALKSTKNTDPYRLFNLDVFEYDVNNPMALYGTVPVMLAHNEKRTAGLFWLNAAETWIDISSNTADKTTFSKLVDLVAGGDEIPQVDTHWFSESGIIDTFIMLGPKPTDVFSQYGSLTGTTPLPPLFSIAYHQCRWNYNDEQDVANVEAGFDEHNLPMDVLWLDIEHTDGKRYFTWDKDRFPTPEKMQAKLAKTKRKMVVVVDPHLKKDTNWDLYQEALDKGVFIPDKHGNVYDGWCWPGSSSWPDFLNPAIREYWASKFLLENYKGSTCDLFIWNDMNEPSVFNGPETTMHKDAKHYGGWEHRDVHNIYGSYVHRATYEGLLQRCGGDDRPFILTRSFFAGSQRTSAVWTGDNTGEWAHLKISIPMVLSLSLVGITFSGADVGGFFKNPEPELLTRWYQAGAYQPFFRAHAHLDTRRREPWLLPDEHLTAIREALRARYRLLPYWYTLFFLNERDGIPPMRPLWVEFPSDKSVFDTEDEHLVGPGLLVHPVTDQGATGVSVRFPGENEIWYDVDDYRSYLGGNNAYISVSLNKIPVYQRGGYIIPRRERLRRASSLTFHDPFTLVVALDKQGKAKGDLYIDDYRTFQYRRGKYSYRAFTFEDKKLKNQNADQNGSYQTKAWLERVVVVGYPNKPSKIQVTSSAGTHDLDSTYAPATKVLTIRKPDVNIAEDWTISIQ